MAVVVVAIAAVTAGHYLTPQSLFLWHNIFQRLYYLPIVYAAIIFGWQGGLAAAVCSGVCYIPHIMMWHGLPEYSTSQYAEIVVFHLVGTLAGVLADRERKRRQELQRSGDKLGKVNRELQDSFEQLKRADRLSAIGQLSAGLAHEIRNPLASIEGAIDILQRNTASEERRQEFLGIMMKECRRLSQLLTDLLDFAKPRPPVVQAVEVARIIDAVVSLVDYSARRGGIGLHRDIEEGLPAVKCDADQLQQVVLDLVLNAIQAMPEGGKVILSAWSQDSNVLIHVKDEGCGIAEPDLEKIFDPFFTTKESGTGLGLSVVHQIVRQHGGRITLERNIDKGMTFTLLLPAHNGGMAAER